MAMLHKWATGSHTKANQKADSNSQDTMEASGAFSYVLPRAGSVPGETAGTVGAATTPYAIEQLKQYSTTGRANLGGSKNQTTTKLEWYNILRMWKWRKIMKNRDKVGVEVAAPNTNLYEVA
jgi:hypothetical protein